MLRDPMGGLHIWHLGTSIALTSDPLVNLAAKTKQVIPTVDVDLYRMDRTQRVDSGASLPNGEDIEFFVSALSD